MEAAHRAVVHKSGWVRKSFRSVPRQGFIPTISSGSAGLLPSVTRPPTPLLQAPFNFYLFIVYASELSIRFIMYLYLSDITWINGLGISLSMRETQHCLNVPEYLCGT